MLTIIGCGNTNRGDDGVGVVVAKRLAARFARHPVRDVQVFDCGTAGIDVMFAARGSDALILVDASRTGGAAGTVYRVPGEELARVPELSYSLHDFRWDHALFAGKKIFGDAFPEQVTVWLVEARSLDYSLELTAPVAAAANEVYGSVLVQIAEYAAAHGASAIQPLPRVTLRRGTAQVPRAVVDAHFPRVVMVIPLMDDNRLCLMPVDELAGGLLFKIRNAHGDRAVDLSDVLRANDWDTEGEYQCDVAWEPRLGALALTRVPAPEPLR
jgi:hydrogenase maturation protease